jgi:aminoglycoside/choline kinase family phosphotransferase
MESKSERKVKFDHWLSEVCSNAIRCTALPADASTRQYYCVVTSSGKSYIAMDAPPPIDCQPFANIATALRGLGLQAPEIRAADFENGFLLLTDFGELTYLKALKYDPSAVHADELYGRALRALAVMQDCRNIPDRELETFGREWMEREWVWHQEWFLQKWLGLTHPVSAEVNECYEKLIVSALEQPLVFMHRDYHSANLMVLPTKEVGILDFQDAFMGPVTYDLASLLRDSYINWRPMMVEEWAFYYANLLREKGGLKLVSDATFMQWFDWMGIQRHIKALMTFARKAVRDNDPRYLDHVPRTLNYITNISGQYQSLSPLTEFYSKIVDPAVRNMRVKCEP